MVFLVKALIIALKRVILTLFNIVLFRYLLDFIQKWISEGAFGFIITIYLSDKIKKAIYQRYLEAQKAAAKKASPNTEYNINRFSILHLTVDLSECNLSPNFLSNAELSSRDDLFNYIFNAATNSSLLNFLTIIGIEFLCNTYKINIVQAILYCVSITFVICFGSSYRYASVISTEWQQDNKMFDREENCKKIIFFYDRHGRVNSQIDTRFDDNKEFVCMWLIRFDSASNISTVYLKYLAWNHSSNLSDIINLFIEIYTKKMADQESDSTWQICAPDYYDQGLLFTNSAKQRNLKSVNSHTEFNLFPGVHFRVNIFENHLKSQIKKEN